MVMTDHARAALEGYGPVFEARQRWMDDPTPANKAAFRAASDAYRARFDCSCPTEGPRICRCTYTPPGSAPHSDASDNITHFDSGESPMPTLKSYAQHLADCGGDEREAQARFHAETHNSRRPTQVASLRSDAVDDAEAAMRLANAVAHCRTPGEIKAVQRQLAERASREGERRAHLSSIRFDSADNKCACGATLVEDNYGRDSRCVDCEERAMKKRNANAWKQPLRSTNQRSAGTIGHHPTDFDDGAA